MIPPLFGSRLWLALGAIVLLAILAFAVPSCVQRHRSAAAQARLNAAQGQAAVDSGKAASEAQAAVNGNDAAGEALGRSNEKDIRNAEGANAAVAAPVNDAGLASLCRRAVYHNSPRCRMFNAR